MYMERDPANTLLNSFYEKREVFFLGVGSAFDGVVKLLINRGMPDAHLARLLLALAPKAKQPKSTKRDRG